MKGLSEFLHFDWDAFSTGKTFLCNGVSDYKEYKTDRHLGKKVEAVIVDDQTPYHFKDGKTFTNRFEKIVFKINKDVNIPVNAQIIPKGVTATVYGDFRNQLSAKCQDIEIVAPAKSKA